MIATKKIIGCEPEAILIMPLYDNRNVADWRIDTHITYEDMSVADYFTYVNKVSTYDVHAMVDNIIDDVMKNQKIPSSWSM